MIFIDTGYLIALLDNREEFPARAVAWSKNVRESLMTTEYVLWEGVNYFSFGVDRPRAWALAQEIMRAGSCTLVWASQDLLSTGLAWHQRYRDKSWSLTDCISFLLMEERGITRALAYDHHFEQAGFEALLRRDP